MLKLLKLIKPLPIVMTLFTATGILMHDMHIDKATAVAIAAPAALAASGTSAAYEKVISQNYHTHVERVSLPKYSTAFRSTLPNMQPPRDDDRRYVQNKKLLLVGGGNSVSLWPSV